MSRSLVAKLVSIASLAALSACHSPAPTQALKASSGIPHVTIESGDAANESVDATRARLRQARAHHLEMLHAYWQAGLFPENTVKPTVANIFRDAAGHLCAVANMVDKDGLHELVDRTARQDNLVRVADLDAGELHDWVLTSGFTREEIAMIQVPYMPRPGEQAGPVPVLPQERPVVKHDDSIARARAAERKRIQSHLAEVERRLRDDTELSLDVAVRRAASVTPKKAS
jgi:hypothetical protein